MTLKTSILLFFLRMSKNTKPVMRKVSWALLCIVNLAGITLTILNIFQCKPIYAAWTENVVAKCIPLLTELVCAAPINIVTDLAILALPIPVLTGMQLPPRQKYVLVFTFALWVFVTIVDVIRVYYLQTAVSAVPTTVSGDPSAIIGSESDFAWNASMSFMWSAVEVNVGMTCACIPTLKQLIVTLFPGLVGESRDGSGRSTQKEPTMNGYRSVMGTQKRPSIIKLPPIVEPPVPEPAHIAATSTPVSPSSGAPTQAMDFAAFTNGQEHYTEGNEEPHPSEYMDFITALNLGPPPTRETRRGTIISTAGTIGTARTRRGSSHIYFGFVNMKRPQTMLHVSSQESFRYCTVVTILFLLWGISYGFLYTLNNAVAAIANLSEAETLGLTSAYFGGGYIFGPLVVGEWILRHDEHRRTTRRKKSNPAETQIGGFKATFILGLCIYGIGTITFWPSAVISSFAGFMFSNFVVGFGLAVLETAANPFIALCGPTEYSEMRLLFSQAIQAVGAVLSGLLAQKVFFVNLGEREYTDSRTLLDVQWTYLAITLFCVVLALFFYYMPLPEVLDSELEEAADKISVNPRKKSIGGVSLRAWSLTLAILAQWTYMAAQENVSIFFHEVLTGNLLTSNANGNDINVKGIGSAQDKADLAIGLHLPVSEYLLVVHSCYAVSRFFVGYMAYLSPSNSKIPEPRTILLISSTLSLIFGAILVFFRPSDANIIVIPAALFFFANGPIWPLVFALGLRGQGNRTKRAGAFLVMGGSGPAFFPFVVWAIMDKGGSVRTAFIPVVALLAISCVYAVWLHVLTDAELLVDPPARHMDVRRNSLLAHRGQTALPPIIQGSMRDIDMVGINHSPTESRKHRLSGSTLMSTFSWRKEPRKPSTASESGS